MVVRAGNNMILIRMSPLTMASEVRMRMATVWNATIDSVAGRVGLDYFRSEDGRDPGGAAQPSLVLTLLLPPIIIFSIV